MAVESDWTPSSAWTVQCRVVGALILREIHSQFGGTTLGYIWAVFQAGISIAVFWAFRELLGFHAPHGMGNAIFLLCGFIPWNLFNQTVTRCLHAVDANRALLTFPQVTELDLMVGRLIVVWGTQLVCAGIILAFAIIVMDQPFELRHPWTLVATIFFAPLLGFGVGMVFASLARLWSTLERLIPLLMRVLFFASGIFYLVSGLPARFSRPLLYNPLAQIIEWQRYGFTASTASPMFNIGYIVAWCVLSLFFGFLLERHVRGRHLR